MLKTIMTLPPSSSASPTAPVDPAGPEEAFAGEPEALTVLRVRLQELCRYQGKPSFRELAKKTRFSQTTAHKVIRCATLPRWGNLELIVEALDGPVEEFRNLWLHAEQAAGRAAELVSAVRGIHRPQRSPLPPLPRTRAVN
ncbi:hypothetical protein GCM10009555_003090 [Acrocarpospora macrocephala]|uniref:Uncharacterized protein n=1 Tax=Acrocarpospora macrocephala TaxID=150177 RepID=A0A5M3WSE6_9ACTN|nr:helix-turn-helix transcriptional regulator [Acrocarpospora macrocephala]GES11784.1 hypothetical protein Amac_053810 [Acrocarpospora macrocephala]